MEQEGRLSRRHRRHLSTKEEIIAAAREVLLETGPEGLSLREVARRADFVSPAALYTYFSSRDELLTALFAESFERLAAYLRRVPSDLPPDQRIVELGMAYLDFGRENPVDLRCILTATALYETLPPDSGIALGLSAARMIAEVFQEGIASGVFGSRGPLSVPEMAYGTWALVHGMVSISQVELGRAAEVIAPEPRKVLETWVALLAEAGRRIELQAEQVE